MVIRGRVLDVRGQPVKQARVYFTSGPTAMPDIAALTGDDGQFTLDAPAPGTYRVATAADGFATEESSVEVSGDASLHVRLQRSK